MKRFLRHVAFRWSGFDQIQRLASCVPNQTSREFLNRCIQHFAVEPNLIGELPDPSESTVFVCNHPSGALDLLAIHAFLQESSHNLKVVCNPEILKIEPLSDFIIPVFPPSRKRDNENGKRLMAEHLQAGGNLLLYPAGKVGFQKAGVVIDFVWKHGSAQIIQGHAKRVIPIYVDARNSNGFYRMRSLFPRLSLLYILRAMNRRPRKKINVYFGNPIATNRLRSMSPADAMGYLRDKTFSLKEIHRGT